MERKSSFFNIVLLFILAFLSLTLAALAGFVFIYKGSGDSNIKTVMVTPAPQVYSDYELADYELITEKATYNLKNMNSDADLNTSSPPIIQTTVYLKYLIKLPKESSIKDPLIKLDAYKFEMQSLVNTYFMTITKDEALNPTEAKEKASKVLTNQINDLLNANEKDKTKVVFNIAFPIWAVF